jgi:hypothetical protein
MIDQGQRWDSNAENAEDIDLCGQCLLGHSPTYRLLLRRLGRGLTLPERPRHFPHWNVVVKAAPVRLDDGTAGGKIDVAQCFAISIERCCYPKVLIIGSSHPVAYRRVWIDGLARHSQAARSASNSAARSCVTGSSLGASAAWYSRLNHVNMLSSEIGRSLSASFARSPRASFHGPSR